MQTLLGQWLIDDTFTGVAMKIKMGDDPLSSFDDPTNWVMESARIGFLCAAPYL